MMLFYFILLFFLFREREREAEGEAGSTQEAPRGTQSRVPRITPRAAGGAKPLCHQDCPNDGNLDQDGTSGDR